MTHPYSIEEYSLTTDASRYVAEYRDVDKFMALCQECDNYGNCWACPPFTTDWLPILRKYDKVTLFVTRITPEEERLPLSESVEMIRRERVRIEKELRVREEATGGRAFAYAGKCLYCPDGKCARTVGKPCLHPELVRPSLEAIGFDIGKTVAELFDLRLLWGESGMSPAYFLLVSAVFHD